MSNRGAIGWAWVAGQVVVLGALILLPGRRDWPLPGWADLLATLLYFTGFALILAAALGLGTALTPTPVPSRFGSLKTGGFYRFVRHPIYTGVLTLVAGTALGSRSWIKVAIAVAAVVFFDRKAAWEEGQLAQTYPDYPAYAAVTPKFVPQPWRTHSRKP